MKSAFNLMFVLFGLFVMMKIITAEHKKPTVDPNYVKVFCPQRKLMLRKLGEKYYYLGAHFELNWYQAFLFCRRHTMNLASISTKEEDENVGKLIKDTGIDYGRFWISGSDLSEKGKYHWMANGELVSYTNWRLNQPDNFISGGETEHCIELGSSDDGKTYLWNDAMCSAKQYFICEA